MAERTLIDLVPDPEDLLRLEPEEVAGVVLEWINSAGLQVFTRNENLRHASAHYIERFSERVLLATMEAWSWLEREGLLVPYPGHPDSYFVSRRGKQLVGRTDLKAYQLSALLPKQLLHPLLAQKVTGPFLRGEYDTAVFVAFREVEVAVRAAGGFAPADLGVDLMRKAFHIESGPLTDTKVVIGERQGMTNLFAGAIALFKNPSSHSVVQVDAAEAVELIMLASRLLKLVEARKAASLP